MNVAEVITLVESGIRVGLTATEIVQRLCSEQGGEILPTLKEFEARVNNLRNLPDLAAKDKA